MQNMIGSASSLMTGGSSSGNKAGSDMTKGDGNFDAYANVANAILDRGLMQAIPYTERNTQYGIQAMTNFYQQARQDVVKYDQIAQNQAIQYHDQANARLSPISEAGYTALDQSMDILGMPRFAAGSSAVAAAQRAKANKDAALKTMQQAGLQLMSSIPGLDPQSQENMRGAIMAGGDPSKILLGLQQLGITGGASPYKTNNTNPDMRTTGLNLGDGLDHSQGMGGGGGMQQQLTPAQLLMNRQLGMSVNDASTQIPSVMGDTMNQVGSMLNQVNGAGNFNNYLNDTAQAYNQYKASAMSPQQMSILNAIRSGTTGTGLV